MVRDRSGGLHGNVSSHSNTTVTLRSSLAIAGTSRINLLLKDYPVLIPGLVPPRGAWRSAFGVRRSALGARRSAFVLVLASGQAEGCGFENVDRTAGLLSRRD